MIDAASASYGNCTPSPLIAGFISISQHCPHNWLGRQTALLCRKLVMWSSRLPLDTAVGAIRLRCYLHDNVSERKFLFLPWLYDPQERDLIARELPGNGVFIDIGANVGIYTLWACQSLARDGTVIAIEPNPVVYDRLRFNLSINRMHQPVWPQVRTLSIAISDQEGTLDLHLDRTNLGGSSLIHRADSTGRIQVPARPLLPVLADCGIDRIDILKIDIEGAEDQALLPFLNAAGAPLLPRLMIIENSEHRWRSDLGSAIKRRGYAVELHTKMNTVYRYIV